MLSKTLFKSMQSVKVLIIRRMGIRKKGGKTDKRDVEKGNEGEKEKRKEKMHRKIRLVEREEVRRFLEVKQVPDSTGIQT